MAEPVRHRQTKGAATDMFDLQLPRHTSTLPRSLGVGINARCGYNGSSNRRFLDPSSYPKGRSDGARPECLEDLDTIYKSRCA